MPDGVAGFGDVGESSKKFRLGTDRCVSPLDTLARVTPFTTAFGITRVANLTGLDRTGIPVVMVCRPNSRLTAVYHGKGIDLASAKVSGVMEAIETWHAENVELPLRFASFAELSSTPAAAEVDRLPRLPDSRFDPDAPMLWVEGRNLIDGKPVWTPYEIVHTHATIDGPPATGGFAASTNGLASGNHILEAASHAICELIERDATALWRQSDSTEQDARRLDLATIDDEACLSVLDLFRRAEIDVAVWDVTSDIGVPAFQCTAADRTGEIGHVGVGAGCHPTKRIALLRAITEAAQTRTTYIVGSREDIEHRDYSPAKLTAQNARARAAMRPGLGREFASIANSDFETFDIEVAWLVDRLRATGIRQVLAIDLTRREFGIPVVRIVAPGLEGFDHNNESYAPGARARALRARVG